MWKKWGVGTKKKSLKQGLIIAKAFTGRGGWRDGGDYSYHKSNINN